MLLMLAFNTPRATDHVQGCRQTALKLCNTKPFPRDMDGAQTSTNHIKVILTLSR